MQTGFFVLETIGKQSSNQMDDKIDRTAVVRMFFLGNILELVNDTLNDGSFAQQEFIREVQKLVLHVFAHFRDEVKTLFKEQAHERSGNVAAISDELAAQSFHHLRNGSAIIHIARSQTTSEQIATIIDSQVQFEAIKPAHAALATAGIGSKDAMLADPFGITDLQRGRVNKTDASTRSIATLQVAQQRNHDRSNERHKALIAN